ncbi:MAG: hypothetical protein KAS73_10130 [Candidatus Sabulitectum sp.]|nr:hypothetical protein [Candidatus Sabulitectum sp.]
MLRSLEARIEVDGKVYIKESIHLSHACRAIVTIFDEPDIPETAILSEVVLGEDWNRPEEEEAWSHLLQIIRAPIFTEE